MKNQAGRTAARSNKTIILRLGKGDKIVESLAEFCRRRRIRSAYISGLGSCRGAELGFFDWEKKKYRFRKFRGDYEIAALLGNVRLKEGRPFVHAHAVLSGPDFRAVAGHLKEAKVLALCEIALTNFKVSDQKKT
jgi:predicted DNA-binding protein with PD1-like motif